MKNRLVRVCELIRRELGSIVGREIQFSAQLVTIQTVDITPDLKHAHVFVSAIGTDAQKREALELLEQKRNLLQHELSKRVVLKYTPHLHFKLDESIERGTKVIQIMNDLGLNEP